MSNYGHIVIPSDSSFDASNNALINVGTTTFDKPTYYTSSGNNDDKINEIQDMLNRHFSNLDKSCLIGIVHKIHAVNAMLFDEAFLLKVLEDLSNKKYNSAGFLTDEIFEMFKMDKFDEFTKILKKVFEEMDFKSVLFKDDVKDIVEVAIRLNNKFKYDKMMKKAD